MWMLPLEDENKKPILIRNIGKKTNSNHPINTIWPKCIDRSEAIARVGMVFNKSCVYAWLCMCKHNNNNKKNDK